MTFAPGSSLSIGAEFPFALVESPPLSSGANDVNNDNRTGHGPIFRGQDYIYKDIDVPYTHEYGAST